MHHKSSLGTLLSLILIMFVPAATAQDSLNIDAYKGQLVYLDFWASWCGPCRQSFPWMMQMHEKYHNDGLTIIAVNLDEDVQMRDAFLKDFDTQFKTISDAEGLLAQKYELLGMPYSILFDRNGKIVKRHHGFRKSEIEDYENEIIKYLKMEGNNEKN